MNQRELFEAHFKPITGWDFYWSDSINQYMDHQTNAAWFGWQASAQREGYKLVPVEMHWHKADDLASAEWDKHKSLFLSDNRDFTALQVEEFRLRWCENKAHQIMNDYKTMIGAAE